MSRAAPAVILSICFCAGPALAQEDVHAQALTRASCQAGKQSDAVKSATAALDRDTEELGPRLRLADELVDQGCYQEAVALLEAGRESHPHSSELAGKLRDVRSLVTEQTYIEGLTQAAEGAKFQRNQLRCTRLADATACDDALKSKPDDAQLWVAKGDALMQGSRAADAVAAYRHAAQLRSGDDVVKSKLTAAETLQANTAGTRTVASASATAQAATASASGGANTGAAITSRRPRMSRRAPGSTVARAPKPVEATPRLALLEPQNTRTYSHDAPPGQTN